MFSIYQNRFNLKVYGKHQLSKGSATNTVVPMCTVGDRVCTVSEYHTGPIQHWNTYLLQQKKVFQALYKDRHTSNVCLTNFDLIRTISRCKFGRIILAALQTTSDSYAIKVMERALVVKKKMVKQVIHMKQLLHSIRFPFIITSEFSFKDNNFLYIAMPYVKGPTLFRALKQVKRFNEDDARFYAGQVVLALEYLHNLNIVYRELKLENMLLDDHGYIKLISFERSKILEHHSRTYTICGTDDYIAPEIILGMGYHLAVDWWALGILLYELCSGHSPFSSTTDISVKLSNICSGKYQMDTAFSLQLKELIFKLLQVDVTKRLGNLVGGVDDIKNHLWFNHFDFLELVNRRISPSRLKIKFHKEFIKEETVSLAKNELYAKEFENF